MRRSKRFTAIEAAKQLFGENSENDYESSESSDSQSEISEDETYDTINSYEPSDWKFVGDLTDSDNIELPETPTNCGISVDYPSDANDNINFFLQLFLTEELFEMLCYWTNKKAEMNLEEEDIDPSGDLPTPLSRWRPTNVFEVKKLLGILLCMQMNRKPEIRSYWSRNIIYKSDFFQDSKCLSRNRFEDILRHLRFCDYADLDETDDLCKIRPFLTFVQTKCKTIYVPQKEICTDESLLLFKGRIRFRRYIPTKRARYGILSYCLCESRTGYTWNVEVAAGKSETERCTSRIPEEAKDFAFSEKIVIILLSNLLDKGYHLFVDNFFSSVRLAEFLFERKTLLTGTIRQFRGVPKLLKEKQVPVKSHAFCRRNSVLLVKHVDRKSSGLKTLYIVDTAHKAGTTTQKRTLRGGVEENVEKSLAVVAYNKGMGGVDSRDGSLHPYSMTRKSFKWFTKLAFHLIHVMIKNSWIIYKSCGGDMEFLSYQERVIEILVLESGEGRRGGALGGRLPQSRRPNSQGEQLHIPKRLSPRPNKPRPAKKCRVCSQEGRRKETVFMCPDCPTTPGLCIDPCFRKYHS